MKTKLFLSALCFFSVAMSYLPSGFAQTKDLPAGARARLGETIRCTSVRELILGDLYRDFPADYLWDFDYSPDSRSLVVAWTPAYEGISLYDARTAQKVRDIAAWSTSNIRSVVFSPDGTTLAANVEGYMLSLIDIATGSKSFPRDVSVTPCSIAWLSLDRSTLACVIDFKHASSLRLSNLTGGSRRQIEHKRQNSSLSPFILSVGFDSDGSGTGPYTVASASKDGIIHLWDVDDGTHLQKFTQYGITGVYRKTSEEEIAVLAESEEVTFISGDEFHLLVKEIITEVGVDPSVIHDGKNFSPAPREFWRTISPNLPGGPAPNREAILALFDHLERYTGDRPLDSVQNPANIIHLRETTWKPNDNQNDWEGAPDYIQDKGNVLKHKFIGHTGCVWNVVYGEDGEEVASASVDGTIRTWHAALGGQNKKFASHTLHFSNIAFSPNGKALAVGGDNGTIQVRVNGTWWEPFKAHDGPVTSLAFHPWWEPFESTLESGEVVEHPVIPTLASAGTDGTVRLWSLYLGAQEARPRTEGWVFYVKPLGSKEDFERVSILLDPLITVGKPATSVAFSPDGNTLAIGSWSGVKVIKLWTARYSAPPIIYFDPVMSVAFSPESQTLAAGCLDGTIQLGGVTLDGRTETLTGHTGSVFKVMFSPDGKTLASGSDDGTVLLWDHEPVNNVIIRVSKPPPSEDEDEDEEAEADEETDDPSPEEDAPTPEDINGDGVVNVQDLVLVSTNMGATGENPADVNGDGVVNIQDLVLIANALSEAQEAPAAE